MLQHCYSAVDRAERKQQNNQPRSRHGRYPALFVCSLLLLWLTFQFCRFVFCTRSKFRRCLLLHCLCRCVAMFDSHLNNCTCPVADTTYVRRVRHPYILTVSTTTNCCMANSAVKIGPGSSPSLASLQENNVGDIFLSVRLFCDIIGVAIPYLRHRAMFAAHVPDGSVATTSSMHVSMV